MTRQDWTLAEEQQLARYWAEGKSTRDIGALLGRNRDAVIGKAHRMDLAARPSPIRSRHYYRMPPEEALRRKRARSRIRSAQKRLERKRLRALKDNVVMLVSVPKPVTLSLTVTCQNIVQDAPRPRDSIRCGKPAIEGKDFCPECHARTHVARKAKDKVAA